MRIYSKIKRICVVIGPLPVEHKEKQQQRGWLPLDKARLQRQKRKASEKDRKQD